MYYFFFFFNDTATTEIYTLSLHDALPILRLRALDVDDRCLASDGDRLLKRADFQIAVDRRDERSEEHTSELQSPCNLVCRLLLEKKKKQYYLVITLKHRSYILASLSRYLI